MVGVSADPPDVQSRFATSLKLPFPLVGNPDGSIGKVYGVRWPLIGYFRRATFFVGRDGLVKAALRQELKPPDHAVWALRMVSGRSSVG